MLVGTRRYQRGSNGCWPDGMLLEPRRYQVGSHGGSSIADASSKLASMDAFAILSRMLWETENFNWHAWMLSLIDREARSVETKPGRQKGSSRSNYPCHVEVYLRYVIRQWDQNMGN